MENSVVIEQLTAYDEVDARQLGELVSELSPKFLGKPISEKLLKEIITSPHHGQIVARRDGVIVATATLSITIGIGAGRKAYLEDFVVSGKVRSHGIGALMWDEIARWCREQNVTLHFTSNAKREAAHRFYLKHGAAVYVTTVFHYDPN